MLEEETTTHCSNNNSNKCPEILLTRHMQNLNEEKSEIPLKSRGSRLSQMGRPPMILKRITQVKDIDTPQVNV